MFCPKCGNKNEDDAAFCGSCGNKLNAPQGVNDMPTVVKAASEGVVASGSTAAAAKKPGKLIGSVVVILVVVAIIATIATSGFGLLGPSVKNSVNDYSWEELSKISAEIGAASDETAAIEIAKKYNLCTPDGKLDGNQIKEFQLKDGTTAKAQITGFAHDGKTGGGKAGITFIFNDAIARHDMSSGKTNAGGWKDSQMRAWLATDGLNMLPDDLKNALVEVDKKTNNVGETKSTTSVSVTADKLWLYSAAEFGGYLDWYFDSFCNDILNAEGSQYKLYRDMSVDNTGSNGILVKWFDGASCYWWERSPRPYGSGDFYGVNRDGNPNYAGDNSDAYGVVHGFCI